MSLFYRLKRAVGWLRDRPLCDATACEKAGRVEATWTIGTRVLVRHYCDEHAKKMAGLFIR